MSIKSSSQINDPAVSMLKTINDAVSVLTMLQTVQADPKFIPNLAKQIADAYKLTQAEKDERDAAAAVASDAQSKITAFTQQIIDTQAQIDAKKAKSDADIKAAKDAADSYVQSANQTISDRWKALDAYKKELDDRELAVAQGEEDNRKDASENVTIKNALEQRKSALDAIAATLATRADQVSQLEQAQLAG